MKIGFIILAHDQPDTIRRLVDILAGAGHRVVIHFDKNASPCQLEAVCSIEQVYPGKVRVISEVHCVWSEWSLVEAVLVALREFTRMPEKPDYVHLLSAADFPIRPIEDLEKFLGQNAGKDFVECCDITKRKWVKGGLSLERFWFYFPVNFRTQRKTFDCLVYLQRIWRIRRKIPLGMIPHMGSQWWTLRWSTCEKILDFVEDHPKVVSYFKSTWIPDESFFPTVIAHLIHHSEIVNIQLLIHHLTPNGRPYIIYKDHIPLIRKLPHFFIRKVADSARDELSDVMQIRNRALPRLRHLARAHDLVCNAIDHSYRHSVIVPGHIWGSAPVRKPNLVVIFLAEDEASVAFVRAQASIHPNTKWMGRPFAPYAIELSDEIFAKTGTAREMLTLREKFQNQFIDALAGSACNGMINAMVVETKNDVCWSNLFERIPDAHVVNVVWNPSGNLASSDDGQFIAASNTYETLNQIAKHQRCANLTISESGAIFTEEALLEVNALGRMGNYIYLDATIHGDPYQCLRMEYAFPNGCHSAQPDLSFVSKQTDDTHRILHLFKVRNAASLVISESNPAYIVRSDSSVYRKCPIPLPRLENHSADHFYRLLNQFNARDEWLGHLALDFHTSAKEFSPREQHLKDILKTIEAIQLSPLVEEWFRFLPAKIEFNTLLEILEVQAPHSITTACRFALHALGSYSLDRTAIFEMIHRCLPRNTKWWVTALIGKKSLGNEQVADAFNSMGTSAYHQGQIALAELCYTAAYIICPLAQSSAWNLGLALSAQSKSVAAARHFKIIRRHYSNESISTCWPVFDYQAWPNVSWRTDQFILPNGESKWPRISIITPSYNQGHFIEETILSVINQNYPNLQYIVVDGNSSDYTRAVLERYRDRIDHLIIEPDDGQTQAINKGFRLADGELVAWLNSDDMYAPCALHQVALRYLSSHADVFAGICAEHRDRNLRLINKPSAVDGDFNLAQLAHIFPNWFSGMYFFQPEVFFTKAMLEKVGLLDESLHYAMDYDLWMRFAHAGAKLEVIDWPFAFFRLHDAQKTTHVIACIAEQCVVRNRHHPLKLSTERKHLIEQKLGILRSKKHPVIAFLDSGQILVDPQSSTPSCINVKYIFPVSSKDRAIAGADVIVLTIGSQGSELQHILDLRKRYPDLLIVGWFLDHDHNPHANHEAATLVDIIIPTDKRTGDYLRNDFAWMGPAVDVVKPDQLIHVLIHEDQ